MASKSSDKSPNARENLVRVVEAYPPSVYSNGSGSSKRDADEKLLYAMREFLANSGWAELVSAGSINQFAGMSTTWQWASRCALTAAAAIHS